MTAVRNVLFVMCDQLRRDFVSCYGDSPVQTPNIDRLAARGVRFDNAFVQSGVCGPARMSFYTGRYVNSHGATWNRVPLSAAEHTLGDYLRAAGRTATLAGKTHVLPDTAGAEALRHRGRIGARRAAARRRLSRRRPLRRPHAAGAGVRLRRLAARARLRQRRSVDRLRDQRRRRRSRRLRLADAQRAPAVARRGAPFRNRVHDGPRARLDSRAGRDAVGAAPVVREAALAVPRAGAVPQDVPRARTSARSARAAGRHRRRASGRPRVSRARRMQELRARGGRPPRAPRVHGPDRAGRLPPRTRARRAGGDGPDARHADRLHVGSRRVLRRPRPRREGAPLRRDRPRAVHRDGSRSARRCDARHGPKRASSKASTSCRRSSMRSASPARRIASKDVRCCRCCAASRRPHGATPSFAELDYGFRRARRVLGRGVRDCRAFMVRTGEWKYVHWEGFRPQLFDLAADPHEQIDLGADPRYEAVRARMRERLFDWLATRKRRTTVDDARGRGAHRRPSRARHPHRHLVTSALRHAVRGPLHGHDTRHPVSCLAAATPLPADRPRAQGRTAEETSMAARTTPGGSERLQEVLALVRAKVRGSRSRDDRGSRSPLFRPGRSRGSRGAARPPISTARRCRTGTSRASASPGARKVRVFNPTHRGARLAVDAHDHRDRQRRHAVPRRFGDDGGQPPRPHAASHHPSAARGRCATPTAR